MSEVFGHSGNWLYGADCRAKLAGAVSLTLAAATTQSLGVALCALGLGLALSIWARLHWRSILGKLKAIGLFLIFLWLILPLTYVGDRISLGFLSLSLPGLQTAFLITIKSCAVLLIFLALVGTSSFIQVAQALRSLGVSAKLCWVLLFSCRYLEAISDEYQRLRRAAMLRAFEPKTSVRTYQVYANMLGMTLVRSWLKAQKIQRAMILRGFDGRLRSLDTESDLQFSDVVFFAFLVVIAVLFAGAP